MKNSLVLFFLLMFSVLTQAQEIKIEKKWYGLKYTQASERLNLTEIQEILQINEEAFSIMHQARINHSIDNILSLAGGALLGVALGSAVVGEDVNWTATGLSAGLVAISIPFNLQAKNFTRRGIETYNTGLPYSREPAGQFQPKWNRPISFGLKLGLNWSQLNYNLDRLEVDGTVGFSVGAFADLKLIRSLHIQPEVQYSREGAKNQEISYFNVPVLLKWYILPDTHLNVGPQMGFLLDAGEKEDDFKSQNTSAVVGAGYETPGGFLFDIRAAFGTKSILQDDYSIPSGQGYNLTGMGAWQENLQFSVGYKF